MTFAEFKNSLENQQPPKDICAELEALWIEAKGDWDEAHRIVQVLENREAQWVHAYLHRKEPDEWNARYWYNRCGKPMPKGSFEAEWEQIARELLGNE